MRAQHALGAALIAALGASAGASTCALADAAAASPAEALAIQGLGFELFLALAALAGAALSPASPVERLGLRASRASAPTLALLALGTIALSHALDVTIDLLGLGEHGALADLEATVAGAGGRTFALLLLGIGLAPGIGEELFCRGLVQRGLTPRLGAPAAVAVAALLFGALHADPVHSTFAAILGLYLGALCHLAGSTRAAIGCHVANNLSAVLLSAFAPAASLPPAASIAGGGAFALAALAWAARRPGGPR